MLLNNHVDRRIAYMSMEIALEPEIPTYSGGLGVLAGDTLRSAADLEVPMVAVTLAYRKGYFRQRLDRSGNQTEEPDPWEPARSLTPVPVRISVEIEGRPVKVGAWRYDVRGISGHRVPVYMLDTDQPENEPDDRALTDFLYGGGDRYRLAQETILGIGGVALLDAAGHGDIESWHMNEGHSSLLALALLEQEMGGEEKPSEDELQAVRRKCVFTTHTPVPAGHDKFAWELVRQVLGKRRADLLEQACCVNDGTLNMTYLALRFSRYVNGVAMHHGEVSRGMFPAYPIHAITNGVHAATWASLPFRKLFDTHVPEWRGDNLYLRYAVGVAREDIQEAHRQAKRILLDELSLRAGARFDESIFTIGFARRATAYKRADLVFSDARRLRALARKFGPLQIVYGGKAHPRDDPGKNVIRQVFRVASELADVLRFVYVEDYDMRWAQLITAGVDLWLNTPMRPQEASGTSGMKAAVNGVPSLSILDGWWIEGCFEGVTGWAIGRERDPLNVDPASEAESLYDALEQHILPAFYDRPEEYAGIMRSAIALNASFFNTQRMLEQYEMNAYYPESLGPAD